MCVSAFVCLHCKGCYAILLLLKRVVAMSIHERIREIRQALGLSQAKFAKDISSGYVVGLELGNRKVNDRMIKLICTQYNVNEAWLRDGTGEMFRSASDSRLETHHRAVSPAGTCLSGLRSGADRPPACPAKPPCAGRSHAKQLKSMGCLPKRNAAHGFFLNHFLFCRGTQECFGLTMPPV